MRRATHDTQWLLSDTGQVEGFALGFDFASEHEWGIGPLKDAFGVNRTTTPLGVPDRQITQIPQGLVYLEFSAKPEGDKRKKEEDYALLAYMRPCTYRNLPHDEIVKQYALREARPYSYSFKDKPTPTLGAAWSDSDFSIMVRGDADIAKLRELKAAFDRKDISIAPGKGQGFMRSFGLTFVITSRLEKEVLDTVLAADIDYMNLQGAVEELGILKRLKDAKREYFACSPRWADDAKTEVRFWLNPMQQDKNNHGWFTAEELDEWIAGTGPIPKSAEDAADYRKRMGWK